MTPVIFVCMLRHTAATAVDLLRDIAGAAQPGDHVLIIDDAGQHDLRPQATQRHVNRFLSQDGWPEGVSSTMIVTGTPAMGDLGVTVNLALAQLAIPGATPDPARVLFLAGGTRLCAESLAAARHGAEVGGYDLFLLPWQRWRFDLGRVAEAPEAAVWAARPGETAHTRARRIFPPLQGLLVARGLLQQLRADEGRRAYGTLALVWSLLAKARSVGIGEDPMGHGPDDRDLDPDLIAAARDLLRRDPAAAPALASSLARALPQVTPGVRGALLTAAVSDPRPLPVIPEGMANPYPLTLLTSKDRARLAQALPRPGPGIGTDRLAAPALLGRAKIRLSLAGRHARLMPFSWEALRPLWQDHAETVPAGEATDLVLWAHPQDPSQNGGQDDSAAAASPAVQALFSEEPFWDTIFGPDPLAHRITVPAAGGGTLALHQVNHHRSAVYAFDHIPYFLLTRPEYAARYAVLFARNAKRSAQDWQEAFAARPRGLVFMAERRPEPYHDVSWPQGDLLGLCAWRTRLAETMSDRDRGQDRGFATEKIGISWGNGQSRFVLGDWHQDKLEGLDGQLRLLSALENTHQPDYLSEKLFDAFAVGARPLYMASPGHRLHDLGLPDAAWINLWGHSSDEAALAIMAAPWDLGFFTAYAEAQQTLARLWTNPEIVTAERARLGRALKHELERLADCG